MIIKPNPNGTDSTKMYNPANYPSAGVYEGFPQEFVILVAKKESICFTLKQSVVEEAFGINISDNIPLSAGFSINDVLKLIAVKNDSAHIEDLIK